MYIKERGDSATWLGTIQLLTSIPFTPDQSYFFRGNYSKFTCRAMKTIRLPLLLVIVVAFSGQAFGARIPVENLQHSPSGSPSGSGDSSLFDFSDFTDIVDALNEKSPSTPPSTTEPALDSVNFFTPTKTGNDSDADPVEPEAEKPESTRLAPKPKPFPLHWGTPPEIQAQDKGPLPGGYGMGSSTLAHWIEANMKADDEAAKPGEKPEQEEPVEKPTQEEPGEKPEQDKPDASPPESHQPENPDEEKTASASSGTASGDAAARQEWGAKGVVDLGISWKESDWFGVYWDSGKGWIYHLRHGWIFPDPSTNQEDACWIFFPDFGWLYTGRDIYPFLYIDSGKNWIYFMQASEDLNVFFSFADDEWFRQEEIASAMTVKEASP